MVVLSIYHANCPLLCHVVLRCYHCYRTCSNDRVISHIKKKTAMDVIPDRDINVMTGQCKVAGYLVFISVLLGRN